MELRYTDYLKTKQEIINVEKQLESERKRFENELATLQNAKNENQTYESPTSADFMSNGLMYTAGRGIRKSNNDH